MVWGIIACDSRSTLIVMRGTLTGQRYFDDILRLHVGPFLNGLHGAIFHHPLLRRNWSYPNTLTNGKAFSITKGSEIGTFLSCIVCIYFKTTSSKSSWTHVLLRFEQEFNES
ncbi:hypothetical protein TNCV_1978381 [Trichonephila clavipes]|nr:hypothetical protein TNCV_1978381 [Trichonephila clavipes]